MHVVAGLLMLVAGLSNLAASVLWLLGGSALAMLGGVLGIGTDLFADAMPAVPQAGREEAAEVVGIAFLAGGGLAILGVVVLVIGLLQLLSGVFLFSKSKRRFIMVTAILGLFAEAASAALLQPALTQAPGIVASLLALLVVRGMPRSATNASEGGQQPATTSPRVSQVGPIIVIVLGAAMIALGVSGVLERSAPAPIPLVAAPQPALDAGPAAPGSPAQSNPPASSPSDSFSIPADAPTDHAAFLRAKAPDIAPGKSVRVGPVVMHAPTRFGDSIWVELAAPLMSSFSRLPDDAIVVEIVAIDSTSGTDLYDPTQNFESEFFRQVSMRARNEPAPHLWGRRNVHMAKGAKAADATRITGRLKVNLPHNIEVLSTTAAASESIDGQFARCEITKVDGNDIQFTLYAKREQLLTMEGLDAAGNVVAKKGTSWGTWHDDKTPFSVTFEAPVATLRLVLAEEIKRYQMPFVLPL